MIAREYVPFRETEKRTGDLVYDSIKREFVRFVTPKIERKRRK